jgi:hypothetical protein
LSRLRESGEVFAEWRDALGDALREIDHLAADDSRWAEHSNEIITEQLEPTRQRLEKVVKKSSGLATLRKGVTSFSFSGIGAVAGLGAGGSLLSTLTSAAAGKAAEFGVAYLSALKEKRDARAVLDVIVSLRTS